jgi:hypothetical protein
LAASSTEPADRQDRVRQKRSSTSTSPNLLLGWPGPMSANTHGGAVEEAPHVIDGTAPAARVGHDQYLTRAAA